MGTRHQQHGFSFIELGIALCLVSVCLVSGLQLQRYIVSQTAYVDHASYALSIAEQTLELLKTRGADPDRSDAQVWHFDTDLVARQWSVNHDYQVRLTVLNTFMQGTVKHVQVTVSWPGTMGSAPSVTLTTMISKFSEFD